LGIEPATFWLVTQCLDQLCHCVPPNSVKVKKLDLFQFYQMTKPVMNYSPEGEGRVGMPKARWIDVVNDMTQAGVSNWRTEAKDTDGWLRILEEAKAHLEL